MRKMKKLAAAALAVAMAVSMLTLPAWAAGQGEEVDTTSPNEFKNGSASTNVNIKYSTDTSQLTVTVPLNITFAVKSTGEFVTPTEGTYYIQNNSIVPIHVEKIEAKFEDNTFSEYSFVNSNNSLTDKQVYLKLSQAATTTEADTSKGNSVTFETPNESNSLKGKWNIAAMTNDGLTNEGPKLSLKFEGNMYKQNISNKWANSTPKLCTITYTIAAGTAGSGSIVGN